MVLSDLDITTELHKNGGLRVEPYDLKWIQPASIDLHLGREFLKPKADILERENPQVVDIYDNEEYEEIVDNVGVDIPPLSFLLGTTIEEVYIPPYLTAFIEGRSSVGRKGLFIHNAGYIDPGFRGKITLELFNATRHFIRIHSNMRICQMVVMKTTSPVYRPYEGKYQNQDTVTPSRLYKELNNDETIYPSFFKSNEKG